MRPVKLSMTAFGPFSETEIIEFDKLGESPLFLINGPTGSGKTTILDGICFALYGKTTGNERQAAQMRCDHADPKTITRVELVFELKGRHYRIVREPEQQRPKQRGDGFTVHKPVAEFYRCDENDQETLLVAAKVMEATTAVETLTGLSVEQFRQVMVLPQGEFRRLLIADSSDREKVFGQLFQTQVYEKIESILKQRSADLRREAEASRNLQKGILSSADLDDETALSDAIEQQVTLHEEHRKQKLAAQQALDQARSANEAAQKLELDFQRLERQQQKLLALDERQADISQYREEVAQAHQAIRLSPDFERYQQAQLTLTQKKQKLDSANRAKDNAEELIEKSQAKYDVVIITEKIEEKIDQARAQQLKLEALIERVERLEQLRDELVTKARIREQALGLLEKINTVFIQTEQGLLDSNKALSDISEKLEGQSQSQTEIARLREQLKRRRYLGQYEQQLAECVQQLETEQRKREMAYSKFKALESASQQLEMSWHLGQATLLARELKQGEPCAVCGSLEHPQPAMSSANIPSDSARKAAVAQANASRVSLSAIENQVSALSAKHEQLVVQVDATRSDLGDVASQSLQQLQQRSDAQLAVEEEFENLRGQKLALKGEIEQQSADLEAIRLRKKLSEQASSEASVAMTVAASAVQTAEAEVAEPYRVAGMLEQAIVEVKTTLQSLQLRLTDAKQTLADAKLEEQKAAADFSNAQLGLVEATTDLERTEKTWSKAIAASLFSDATAYVAAIRSDEQLSVLQGAIKVYETDVAQAQGAVESLQDALTGMQRPVLSEIELRLHTQRDVFSRAENQFATIDNRLSQLSEVEKTLAAAKQSALDIEQKYAVIGTLADVANGRTGNRISLQRFVLSVLLDDVLIQASQRLKRMSKGRYELYRQQEKGKGGGASGLELMVEDAYNGRQRPVATLSGGESFMAALSLALGLSDVVQAYAGGIKLDTLFVDEGFGSLDPESLDLAVNTLIDLQSEGRMVGIISHVPELKERIGLRLDVHTDRLNGSSTRVVLA